MTIRICFIGNSHLGAVYKAWKVVRKQHPSLDIDFFIERSCGTKPLQICSPSERRVPITRLENILVIQDDVIDVDAYDAFFVFALGFSIVPVINLYKTHRSDKHAPTETTRLISNDCFLAAVKGALNDTKAVNTLRAIRKHTRRPIHLVAQARPSEYVLHHLEGPLSYYASSVTTGDDHTLESSYLDAAKAICETLDINLIDQPQDTCSGPLLTLGKFGVADPDDRQENSSYSVKDFWHMNENYGLYSLNRVLNHLQDKR